jgi:hypothetical protein
MARTTTAKVQAILEETIAETTIDAFIAGATLLLDEVFEDETEITEDLIAEIERWLTAHMITSTISRMAKKAGAGGASIEYTGQWGKNLESTPYGQQTLALDPTGKLMAATAKKAVMIEAVTSFD